MPGIDLNLDLPSLSDTFSDIVSKLTTALSLIEDDLSDKITSGEIDIDAPLSANGQPIINVGGVQLNGGASTEVGTLYTDGTDFWGMTANGAVRFTAAGALDIAGSGGIGGDYGTGDELVDYDLASQEYRFMFDGSTYADIVCDDVVLKAGTGSVRLGVDPAITTARSFIFKDLPSSGVSCLVYKAATSTVEDAANQRITNDVKVTTLDASGEIKATDYNHDTDFVKKIPVRSGFVDAGGTVSQIDQGSGVKFTSSGGLLKIYTGLRKGDRLKVVYLRLKRTSGGTVDVAITRCDHSAAYTPVESGFSFAGGLGVAGNLTCTISNPNLVALSDYEDFCIHITCPAIDDEIISCSVLWDHPA